MPLSTLLTRSASDCFVFLVGFIFTTLSVAGFCALYLVLDYHAQKAYEAAIFAELKKTTKSTTTSTSTTTTITTTTAEFMTEKQSEETVTSAPPVFNDPPEINLIGRYGLLNVSYKGFLVINAGYESPKPPKNYSMANYLNSIRKRSADFVNSSLLKNTGQDHERVPTDIYDAGKAYVFLNIPYAKAPVGERAMSAPEPMPAADFKKYIEKERDHNNFGPFCPQIMGPQNRRSFYYSILSLKMNLDNCLTLNIYMPADDIVNASYPVHVAIFGGMLVEGSPADYGIRGIVQAFVSENIVVVTLNYRLGVYGFLKMNRKGYSRGNSVRGLYDQMMALKWVNQHIADFKGDPSRVTIGGYSAGACSASTLALTAISSEEVGKLFSQVILESGSVILCSLEGPLKRNASAKLSEKLCPDNSDLCFDNLKKRGNESAIVSSIEETPLGMDINLPDEPLFPHSLPQMINAMRHKTKEFPPLRLYMGVNRDEFSMFDEPIRKIIQYEGPYGQTYVRNIAEMNFKPSTFEKVGKIIFDLTQQGVENEFLNYYISRHHDPNDEEYQYYRSMEALSGITFYAFAMFDACLFARRSSVYLYKFHHRTRMLRSYGRLSKYNLAPHGADFFFVYQPEHLWQLFDFESKEEMVSEVKVARAIQRSYAEFIHGAPIMIPSINKPLGNVYVGESSMQNVTPHIVFDTDGVKWDSNNFIHPTVMQLIMNYVTGGI